ncbi:MAG: polysaccharide deacetylase family protein [Akkermansiaceae bacterium]|nr:polysaccharide deacetylase family protein [Akkermansiaceae bacterium]
MIIKQRPFFLVTISALMMLVACSANDKSRKTKYNSGYRSPSLFGSGLRNPDINLPKTFPADVAVSHRRGRTDLPYIAMTFDDGPHPQNTPRLLDMLRERNIKATFYVVGRNVDLYPHIVRRMVAEGHEVGNHTWTHRNLTRLSNDSVRSEMDRTRNVIVSACGVVPRTMRPPYGALRESQRAWIYKEYGYPTIMWNVDPNDWKRPGVSVVTSRILESTRNGSIVLAHDLHKPTVDAMPDTLDGLLRRGFQFVTISQLLGVSASSAGADLSKPVRALAARPKPEGEEGEPVTFVRVPAVRQ